jgi:hypothetical protein
LHRFDTPERRIGLGFGASVKNTAVQKYLLSRELSGSSRKQYRSMVKKWKQWGAGADIEDLERKHIREFLDWCIHRAH